MGRIIPVTDFDDPALDIYARLSENQLVCRERPEDGLFIAESALVIERALDAGFEPVSFLAETRLLPKAEAILARCPEELPVYTAELSVLERLTGYALTRGMLCAMRRPALRHAEDLLQSTSCVAVLEDVMNPTNLGAIFRSAAALGVEAVLLTESCTDPLYRRCIRVSMGNVFSVPWAYLPDEHWQSLVHDNGFESVAMALREAGATNLMATSGFCANSSYFKETSCTRLCAKSKKLPSSWARRARVSRPLRSPRAITR